MIQSALNWQNNKTVEKQKKDEQSINCSVLFNVHLLFPAL